MELRGVRRDSKSEKVKMHPQASDHPDHAAHIKRLSRAKGQIEGIERMILERRYCPDIIAQLKAASAAIKAVESEIFKAHLRGCVRSAFDSKDPSQAEEKIQEIIKLAFERS